MKTERQVKKKSQFIMVMRSLSKNKAAMVGLFIFLIEIGIAIYATKIAPYNYNEIDNSARLLTPSLQHLCGTDKYGRDLFSRILFGARYSISIGLISTFGSAVVGMIIGGVAGYFGGNVDNIIMRVLDVIQAIPSLLLMIVIAASLGTGYGVTIIALMVSTAPPRARLFRASILNIRSAEYIEVAQSINCSTLRIMLTHVVPNALSPMIVDITMGVANSINTVAGLSFMGLGVALSFPEWGALLSTGREHMRMYPHLVIAPGVAIMITILALNILGDGLRDAMDPKLKN
jgi:peptide/nickel transport system permease protein